MRGQRFTHIRETYEVRLNEADVEKMHRGEKVTKLVIRDEDDHAIEEICVEVSFNDVASEDAQAIPVSAVHRRKR